MPNPVPNFPIVNGDGTPTQYFYAWLLQVRQNGGSLQDLLIAQAFDDGEVATDDAQASSDAALAAFLWFDAPPPAELPDAIAFDAAPAEIADDIAAAFADRAPVAEAAPVLRGLLSAIPSGFNTGDAGRLYYATDYKHWYRWSGSAWTYGDGDEGSGRIEFFAVAPRGGSWQLCDGSTGVSESLANGTAALVAFSGLAAGTMPNLVSTGTYLRGASSCTGAVVAATAPTISGHTETGNAAFGVTATQSSQAVIGNDSGAGTVVQSGTGSTVATHTHTHTDSGHTHLYQPSDTGHQHTLTSANAPIAPGEARHMDALPYYRL